MEKQQFFQQTVLRKLDIHMQKNKLGPVQSTVCKKLMQNESKI